MGSTSCRTAIACAAALLLSNAAAGEDSLLFTVMPPAPTTHDTITLGIEGWWRDGCVPVLDSVQFLAPPIPDGHALAVQVFLRVDASGGCPAAVTAFSIPAPLGRLPAATHSVSVFVDDPLGGSPFPRFLDSTELIVLEPTGEPDTLLRLHDGRFQVTLEWRLEDGTSELARIVPGSTADSGVFWFFSPTNWEMLIKLLDGCSVNFHYWAMGAGATDVAFTVVIEDVITRETWRHDHAGGTLAGSFADVEALPCGVP